MVVLSPGSGTWSANGGRPVNPCILNSTQPMSFRIEHSETKIYQNKRGQRVSRFCYGTFHLVNAFGDFVDIIFH